MKTKELVLHITNFVNNFNDNSKEFNAQMSIEHRTLQQSFTKLCFQWIEHVASDDYQTDLRNESSKKTAQLILKLMAEHFEKEGYTGSSIDVMAKPSNLPLI